VFLNPGYFVGGAVQGCNIHPIDNTYACPDSCKAWLRANLIADLGCCYTNFLDIANRHNQQPTDPTSGANTSTIDYYLRDFCGLAADLPPACPHARRVRIIVTLTNIAATWLTTNMALFRAQVILDVAAMLGIVPERLTVPAQGGVVSQSADGARRWDFHAMKALGVVPAPAHLQDLNQAVVTIDADPDSNVQSDAAADAMSVYINNGADAPLPNTNGLGADAKADATSQSTIASGTVTQDSAAPATVRASVLVALAAMLLAMVLRA
jgi:hypothetical protein